MKDRYQKRHPAIGFDRYRQQYFKFGARANRLYVHNPVTKSWGYYESPEELKALMKWLNQSGKHEVPQPTYVYTVHPTHSLVLSVLSVAECFAPRTFERCDVVEVDSVDGTRITGNVWYTAWSDRQTVGLCGLG